MGGTEQRGGIKRMLVWSWESGVGWEKERVEEKDRLTWR